jgi:hypothetical protein
MAGLVRKFTAELRDQDELKAWTEAVRTLGSEDHYLLALIDAGAPARPRGDLLRLILTALAIVAIIAAIGFFRGDR